MFEPSIIIERYRDKEPLRILSVTAAILVFNGLAVAYQSFLRFRIEKMGVFSMGDWIIYIYGPLFVEPVLLFVVLYYVGSRYEFTGSLIRLIPALAAVIVVCQLLGQSLGGAILPAVSTPLVMWDRQLFIYHPVALPAWRAILEPLVRALLTAIAALGLARSYQGNN